MKHKHATPLLLLVLFASSGNAQLVVKTLGSTSFGHSDVARLAGNRHQTAPSGTWFSSANEVEKPRPAHWKQAVARVVTGLDASKGGNSWEQHKEQKTLDDQTDDLKHAQGALGYLEERAANKLKADIDEVDHLIVRRHLLTDKAEENNKDIATIQKHVDALKKVASNLVKAGKTEEEKAINQEVSELSLAASSLRGSRGEVETLSKEIEATTADGRKMDAQVRKLSKERAAIARQIRVLTQEGDEIRDSEETARDFEAFEKAGYDSMDDSDDPYIQEAEAALERASGWNKDKLDEEAVKRREIFTKGLAANPGQAVQALKALGRHR